MTRSEPTLRSWMRWPLAVSAALLVAAAPGDGLQAVPMTSVLRDIGATGQMYRTADGFGFQVDEGFGVFLPLPGAEVVEVDYRSTGILLLSWTSSDPGVPPSAKAPPWHHQRVEPGPGRLTLDFRGTPGFGPQSIPLLYLEGSGTFSVSGVRVARMPPGAEAFRRSRDAGMRWPPIWIGHSTINWIDEQYWSESAGISMPMVLGAAFLLLALGGAVAFAVVRKRWSPAPVLAVAAVAVALAGNAAFAVRAAPAAALRPQPDAGARLRQNFHMGPEIGALVAMARDVLPPGTRVGVQARQSDWFAWESICFHLAPRPCVLVVPGESTFGGFAGVERLAPAQLDAVVFLHDDAPLLPGFAPAASLAPGAFVARRR